MLTALTWNQIMNDLTKEELHIISDSLWNYVVNDDWPENKIISIRNRIESIIKHYDCKHRWSRVGFVDTDIFRCSICGAPKP